MKKRRNKAPLRQGSQDCNNCQRLVSNINGKPYCEICRSLMFKECKRCHLPLPSKECFELHEERCNKCQQRYINSQIRRRMKKLPSCMKYSAGNWIFMVVKWDAHQTPAKKKWNNLEGIITHFCCSFCEGSKNVNWKCWRQWKCHKRGAEYFSIFY